jgi:hypothetical protein
VLVPSRHSELLFGSADLDDAFLPDEPVDIILTGLAGRGFTSRYWERVLPRLDRE